ncbi:unnamed protein product [Choristocarpus tenellus]
MSTHKPDETEPTTRYEVESLLCEGREVPLLVWTDLPYLSSSLTRPEFKVMGEGTAPSRADILWTSMVINEAFKEAMG